MCKTQDFRAFSPARSFLNELFPAINTGRTECRGALIGTANSNYHSKRHRQRREKYYGEGASGDDLHAFPARCMDTFLDMLPEKLLTHPDGLFFEEAQNNGKSVIAVRSGPTLERVMRGMRHAVAAMAAQGNNLIVDVVMIRPGIVQEYRDLLQPFDLRLVGLFAPLEVLEARERARGDREVGLAK